MTSTSATCPSLVGSAIGHAKLHHEHTLTRLVGSGECTPVQDYFKAHPSQELTLRQALGVRVNGDSNTTLSEHGINEAIGAVALHWFARVVLRPCAESGQWAVFDHLGQVYRGLAVSTHVSLIGETHPVPVARTATALPSLRTRVAVRSVLSSLLAKQCDAHGARVVAMYEPLMAGLHADHAPSWVRVVFELLMAGLLQANHGVAATATRFLAQRGYTPSVRRLLELAVERDALRGCERQTVLLSLTTPRTPEMLQWCEAELHELLAPSAAVPGGSRAMAAEAVRTEVARHVAAAVSHVPSPVCATRDEPRLDDRDVWVQSRARVAGATGARVRDGPPPPLSTRGLSNEEFAELAVDGELVDAPQRLSVGRFADASADGALRFASIAACMIERATSPSQGIEFYEHDAHDSASGKALRSHASPTSYEQTQRNLLMREAWCVVLADVDAAHLLCADVSTEDRAIDPRPCYQPLQIAPSTAAWLGVHLTGPTAAVVLDALQECERRGREASRRACDAGGSLWSERRHVRGWRATPRPGIARRLLRQFGHEMLADAIRHGRVRQVAALCDGTPTTPPVTGWSQGLSRHHLKRLTASARHVLRRVGAFHQDRLDALGSDERKRALALKRVVSRALAHVGVTESQFRAEAHLEGM